MKKNLFRKVAKIALISFLAMLLIVAVVLLCIFVPTTRVELDKEKLTNNIVNVEFFDDNGKNLIENSVSNNRVYATIENLQPYTIDSFVYIEDKRFFSHDGVDIKRIFGAMLENVKSLRFKEGASTITQQLIKNTHLTNEKNLTRKFLEINLARQLEKQYTKNEILEMYLNSIYFGNNAYGIGQAAKIYFGVEPSKLTLSQSAVLAGLINAPNAFAPNKNLAKCLDRRNLILKTLYENSRISIDLFDSALKEKIDISKIAIFTNETQTYEEMAICEAEKLLGVSNRQLRHSKFKIHTYLNEDKQKLLKKSLTEDKTKTVNNKNAKKMGVIADNATGGVSAFFGMSNNNASSLRRQIGSTAKPLVALAPAFDQRLISPLSPILDEYTDFGGFSPKNIGDNYVGWTSIRDSIEKSRNVPAVKLLNSLNKNLLRQQLQSMDILQSEEINLSLALGVFGKGLTIAELTQCYMTLANNGMFQKLNFVKKICDENGNILYHKRTNKTKVFNEDSAYLTTDILKGVVKRGTAKSMGDLPYPIAGKTGTVGKRGSKNNSDALFCSYTPRDTMTVWVYSDYDDLLSSNISGSNAPVKIAKEIYQNLYNFKLPDFVRPSTVVDVGIDNEVFKATGRIEIANSFIPKSQIKNELFSTHCMPRLLSDRNMPIDNFDKDDEIEWRPPTDLFEDLLNALLKKRAS